MSSNSAQAPPRQRTKNPQESPPFFSVSSTPSSISFSRSDFGRTAELNQSANFDITLLISCLDETVFNNLEITDHKTVQVLRGTHCIRNSTLRDERILGDVALTIDILETA